MKSVGELRPSSGWFEGSDHLLPLRVYYEDTDAAGIVYYANYLKFAERARSELLRLLSIDQIALRDRQGLAFAVRKASVDYVSPARLEDLLQIRSRLTKLGGAVLSAHQRVERDGNLLADIRVRVACLRLSDGRPGRIPPQIRQTLAPFCQPET
ncbi:tol-pal system-associated acyl-CoA thioesterase [Algihabitans sp.]|uniref:tol-pal system-associated acyl-CoA thioesterase n=1 Tax=Algihabitans sp. TaxID=2821514 RepID=UPI003BAC522B